MNERGLAQSQVPGRFVVFLDPGSNYGASFRGNLYTSTVHARENEL